MTIDFIAGIIYQFILNDNSGHTLSHRRLKLIENQLLRLSPNGVTVNLIYRCIDLLICLGLIDRKIDKYGVAYVLTSPCMISNGIRTIIINSFCDRYQRAIKNVNYYVVEGCLEDANRFSVEKLLKAMLPVNKIIKNRFAYKSFDRSKPLFKRLERCVFNDIKPVWVKCGDFELDVSGLYKDYQMKNSCYFSYYFLYNNLFYKVEKYDKNTLELIFLYLKLKNNIELFRYNPECEILYDLGGLMEPIRKLVFTNHILTTSEVRSTKSYNNINDDIFNQIKRIYS